MDQMESETDRGQTETGKLEKIGGKDLQRAEGRKRKKEETKTLIEPRKQRNNLLSNLSNCTMRQSV